VGIVEELVEIWPNEVCDNYLLKLKGLCLVCDCALTLCAFDVQLNASPATIRKYSIWEQWSSGFKAQSESVYV